MRRAIVAFSVSSIILGSGTVGAGELGPARLLEALKRQPALVYDFIVSFAEDTEVGQALLRRPEARPIPNLGAVAVRLKVAEALDLASQPGISRVWYVHPAEARGTIPVLQALGSTIGSSNLANMSMGPPESFYVNKPDYDMPVVWALQAAAANGVVPVVAIGNVGRLAPGYVNPWSVPQWVISVGAWDHTVNAVWANSSTGLPDQMETWPDVVAPGVDIISTFPTYLEKTATQKAHDEADPRFRDSVPKGSWDQYTMMSGTSQATAMVTNAASHVFGFVRDMVERDPKNYGDPLFSIEAGPERISAYDKLVPRLTGMAEPTAEGGMTYTYVFDEPWKLVKQILIDTATPVPGAEPWEAGAGLVLPDYIRQQFPAKGDDPITIIPLKVL